MKLVRLSGRVIGVTAAAFWWLIIIAGAIGGGDDDAPVNEETIVIHSVLLVLLVIANTTALVVSFFQQRMGSRLLVFTASLFAVFAVWSAGRNEWIAVSVSALPFFISGALLWKADSADPEPGSG